MTTWSDDPGWRDRLVVFRDKLTRYLMKVDHPRGGGKARFFIGVGFDQDKLDLLATALLEHGRIAPLEQKQIDEYGRRYVLIGDFHALDGEVYVLKSVWLEDEPGFGVRLVTAYPSHKPQVKT